MPQKLISVWVVDLAALVLLAALILFASFLVPSLQLPIEVLPFFYLSAAVFSLFIWRHPKAPKTPVRWLILATCSLIAAPLLLAVATVCSWIFFGGNEPTGSKAVDWVMTALVAPGVTAAALLGWARALVLQYMKVG